MSVNPLEIKLSGHSLTCERGERVLIKNLEFSVRDGQAMIIQGSNGAGKTSLLRIITGLSQATQGSVTWNNQNIESIAEEYQQSLLYIGHLAAVKRELTVRENLQLLLRFWPQDNNCLVTELAEQVGLRQRLSVSCSRLSAGQQRRVSLARLFISTQKLWVLDEPLTAIDVDFIQVIEKRLQNHLKSGGTAILTTHRGIELGEMPTLNLDLSRYEPH